MPSQHYPFAFQMTRDNVFQVGETVWAAEWGRGKGKGEILDKQGHSLWRGPPLVAQQSPPRVKQGPGPKKRVILGGSVPSRHATDYTSLFSLQGLPRWPVVKNPPANAEDMGLIPGSGRSPGGRNGNPLQYSCLENSINRGAWRAIVHGAAKSRTWQSMHTHAGKIYI